MSPARRLARKIVLAAATLAILTLAAVVTVSIAAVTLLRVRRFYGEVLARSVSRAILAIWGVRVVVHRTEPFPEGQTVYVSNHSSTLDMFVLVLLGLPNTRYVGAQDLEGFLRWLAPLGVLSHAMGTLWAPPPSKPMERARWFARTERLLRRAGGSIYLSPEGERVTTGRIGPFNVDNFALAAQLHAPIVPIYIDIPREIDPGRGFDALPGIVHVRVLARISTAGWTSGSIAARSDAIRSTFVGLHEQSRRDEAAAHRDGFGSGHRSSGNTPMGRPPG